MSIDLHAHILTQETMRLMQGVTTTHAPRVEGSTLVVGEVRYPNSPTGTWDVHERLAHMDATGVQAEAVSVVPFTFGYHLEPALAADLCRVQNEQLAGLHTSYPSRFFPLACVPLQDPDAACQEAERCIRQLGLFGLGLGTRLPDHEFDWPALEPFWTTVEALDVPVLFHPSQRLATPELGDYYLVNFIGNPLDTTVMVARLVFGGVLARHPRLKLVLVHAGGFVPYQFGRFDHGWRVRPEARVQVSDVPPSTFIRRYFFDTIAHSQPALDYLIRTFGADHVVLGTDYPYDMGLDDPQTVLADLDPSVREQITTRTPERLLKLPT
jgi:aminocarboxymuconate-semialdehyde decarboxylase